MPTPKLTTEILFELADKIASEYASEESFISSNQFDLFCAHNGMQIPEVPNPILNLNYDFWLQIREEFGVNIVLACNSGINFQSINSRNPKQIFDNFRIDDKETIIVFFTFGKKLILQYTNELPEFDKEDYEEHKKFSEYLSALTGGRYDRDEEDDDDDDDKEDEHGYMHRGVDTYSTTDTILVDLYHDGAWAASKPKALSR